MFFLIILLPIVLVLGCYVFLYKPHRYWKERAVHQADTHPIFGNSYTTIFRKESMAEMVQNLCNSMPGVRYFGAYQFNNPMLIVRDPDLIKKVTVKDFEYFTDHKSFVPEDIDPFWATNLFALTGQKWRDMRSTLSPVFTSSKMRQMFKLVQDVSKNLSIYVQKQNKDELEVEFKDFFTRYATDVIYTAAFGVKTNSLESPNNEYFTMGKEASNFFKISTLLKVVLFRVFPQASKIFNMGLLPKKVTSFYLGLIQDNIKYRKTHGIVRTDLIHMLMEARKHRLHVGEEKIQDAGFAAVKEYEIDNKQADDNKVEITDVTITAQALIFFLAGFDTVSAIMCFMAYELAINPKIQQKLSEEIEKTPRDTDGNVSYEALLEMKYMDMVVSETLRKWPPGALTDRVCTKPYKIQAERPDEFDVVLEKGTLVWIPLYAILRDPANFPDPDRFDPERFNEDNRKNIKPYTYMPFGSGPRNCIGSRLALIEIKSLFFHLLANFEIAPTEKSQIPVQIKKSTFNLGAENGFSFGLKRRML